LGPATATAILTTLFDGMSDIGDKIHWHSVKITNNRLGWLSRENRQRSLASNFTATSVSNRLLCRWFWLGFYPHTFVVGTTLQENFDFFS